MTQKLSPSTVLILSLPPLLWAGNAVVGRAVHDMVPPIALNFMRWAVALLILAPFGASIWRRGSSLWRDWRRYAVLGLLGVGLYNTLQYMALQTSTPVNVTLVGASMPVWMLIVGRMFFNTTVTRKQVIGAVLSIVGVLFILARGQWDQLLSLRFVPGDLFMILAAVVWAFYSWLLTRATDADDLRRSWATFLLAQVTFGVAWSGAFAAGEWAWRHAPIQWDWSLVAAIAYVAIGPAIVAFRCWGVGVQRVGPATAGFFNNLSPLFAAVMSSAFLGEMPHWYHAAAFILIVGGIAFSSSR